jgi:hypothetical protein
VRWLRRCGWPGVLGPMLLATVLVVAGPAQAAFPGRDGLLAIQPSRGAGIMLTFDDRRMTKPVVSRRVTLRVSSAERVATTESFGGVRSAVGHRSRRSG